MMMLLWQSCSGSNGGDDTVAPSEKPMLQINVFTAGHPMVTRGDVGDVNGSAAENEIHKLQVWVFEHHEGDTEEERANDGRKVAYLEDNSPMSQLHNNEDGDILEGIYQLVVSNSFAEAKPNVDVYVLANGKQEGFPELNGNSSRDNLKAALMNDTYGLTTLVIDVPTKSEDDSYGGLPMSGMLSNGELGGQSPVLNVKTPVTVVRTVSKMRFVFSRKTPSAEDPDIKITGITLDRGMIPIDEYLFLNQPYQARACGIKISNVENPENSYVQEETELFSSTNGAEINKCETPSKYAYFSQSGQQYEELIDDGIENEELTPLGKFYFRESDKQMKGTITYEIREGTAGSEGYKVTSKSAPFSMHAAGDFSRNHTWIVYGYFAGSDNLQVISVKINPWEEWTDDSHEVYNW